MTNKLLKKAKQAARRETRDFMNKNQYSNFVGRVLKPKSFFMPQFLWIFLVKLIIKNRDEYYKTEANQ